MMTASTNVAAFRAFERAGWESAGEALSLLPRLSQ